LVASDWQKISVRRRWDGRQVDRGEKGRSHPETERGAKEGRGENAGCKIKRHTNRGVGKKGGR
jgi:hypothetical protein